jgi:hypothetical protein
LIRGGQNKSNFLLLFLAMKESTTPATYTDPVTQRTFPVELLQDEETMSLIRFKGERPTGFADETLTLCLTS